MNALKTTFFVSLSSLVLLAGVGCSSGGDDDGDDDAGSGGTGAGATAGSSGTGGSTAGTGGSTAGTGGSTAGTGGSTGGSAGSGVCNSGEFLANEANNYTFSSTLTIPSVTVKPGSNLHFDWSGVTKDFLKHDMDPKADVATFNVIIWQLTEAELAQKLNDDQLLSSDGQPPVQVRTMNMLTEAELFDVTTVSDEPIPQETLLEYMDPTLFPPETNTFTAILATGGLSGDGDVKMLQSFKLDPASENTTVTLTNTSTTLMYQTDLEALVPTLVPAGSNAPVVDWSEMMTTAMGHDFLPGQITSVRISHYSETPAELEAKFLDLEMIDLATYEAPVPVGRSLAFSELKTETGAVFPGIDNTGTWLLALFCGGTNCRNPAPWYLTVLKPCQ